MQVLDQAAKIDIPSSNPLHYKTLKGLLVAAEKVIKAKALGYRRTKNMTLAQWINNATYAAELNFGDVTSIQKMHDELCVTRVQDLSGGLGHSLFGVPLPTRPYQIGDNIPAVGKIQDIYQTKNGLQYLIDGEWIHERCLTHVKHF